MALSRCSLGPGLRIGRSPCLTRWARHQHQKTTTVRLNTIFLPCHSFGSPNVYEVYASRRLVLTLRVQQKVGEFIFELQTTKYTRPERDKRERAKLSSPGSLSGPTGRTKHARATSRYRHHLVVITASYDIFYGGANHNDRKSR